MTVKMEPARWPRGWLLLASLLCVGLSLWALHPTSCAIADATRAIPPVPHDEWLPAFLRCRGILRLELARSQASAQPIVNVIRASPATQAAAVKNVELDYFLILSYMACLGFLGATVASLEGLYDVIWIRGVLLLVVLLQGIAGVLDGVENIGLLIMLKAHIIPDGVPERTFQVSVAKWALIGIGIAVPLLFFVARPLIVRWRRKTGKEKLIEPA